MCCEITATFSQRIFRSPDETFCVSLYRNKKGTFTAVGDHLPEEAYPVTLEGGWKASPTHGDQFMVSSVRIELPTGRTDIVAMLSSMKIGIGKRKAEKILDCIGEGAFWNVVLNDPEKLRTVEGVSEKAVRKLATQTEALRYRNELSRLFSGLIPMSETQFRRIRTAFGATSLPNLVHLLSSEPYCLLDAGYSFLDVDPFALEKVKIKADDDNRLAATLRQTLMDASQQAHVGLPPSDAAFAMVRLMSQQTPDISACLCQTFVESRSQFYGFALDSGLIYFEGGLQQEICVAQKLSTMAKLHDSVDPHQVQSCLKDYEKETAITLAPEQEAAIMCCLQNRVAIITGGPGTGKSTTLAALLYCWKRMKQKDDWNLMAPTGRAARRMAEATGQNASTIHSTLQIGVRDIPLWYRQTASEVLISNSLVIVDEASIMDLPMMATLCSSLSEPSQHLVLVGDPEQLPSVGPGNILADLIAAERIPIVRLSQVFRQTAGSPILDNAERIRNGETMLDWSQRSCRRYNYETDAENADAACRLYLRCIRAYGIESTMLLTPYRKQTALCSNLLNIKLQDAINPNVGQPHISGFGKTFRQRDRVMQLKNTELVSNGDIGTITGIGQNSNGEIAATITFENGATLQYTSDDLSQLDLAYAFSVHKAQGSQAQNVLVLLPHKKTSFLRRNLFYTAITRAEENFAVFGSLDAIAASISNNRADLRHTRLAKRVKER